MLSAMPADASQMRMMMQALCIDIAKSEETVKHLKTEITNRDQYSKRRRVDHEAAQAIVVKHNTELAAELQKWKTDALDSQWKLQAATERMEIAEKHVKDLIDIVLLSTRGRAAGSAAAAGKGGKGK